MESFRQGDVLLQRVPETKGKIIARNEHVLAYGEVTGHKHIMRGQELVFFEDENKVKTVQIPQQAELVHEEHEKIMIPKGTYKIVLQREFDLVEGVRQVMD